MLITNALFLVYKDGMKLLKVLQIVYTQMHRHHNMAVERKSHDDHTKRIRGIMHHSHPKKLLENQVFFLKNVIWIKLECFKWIS